jgi:hypothetical protein
MCEKCGPIDDQLVRFRMLNSRIDDRQAVDEIKQVIQELEAQKLALHSDPDG